MDPLLRVRGADDIEQRRLDQLTERGTSPSDSGGCLSSLKAQVTTELQDF